jgi:hypothetical protein
MTTATQRKKYLWRIWYRDGTLEIQAHTQLEARNKAIEKRPLMYQSNVIVKIENLGELIL